MTSCLSLYQPFASLVAAGLKPLETRTWATKFTGWLMIHAAKKIDVEGLRYAQQRITVEESRRLASLKLTLDAPLGHGLAMVRIVGCRPLLPNDEKLSWFYAPDRWAFEIDTIYPIVPVPLRAYQKIFKVDVPPLQHQEAA